MLGRWVRSSECSSEYQREGEGGSLNTKDWRVICAERGGQFERMKSERLAIPYIDSVMEGRRKAYIEAVVERHDNHRVVRLAHERIWCVCIRRTRVIATAMYPDLGVGRSRGSGAALGGEQRQQCSHRGEDQGGNRKGQLGATNILSNDHSDTARS